MKIETKLVHAGEPRPRIAGAITLPVFQSSTYEAREELDYHDVRYARLNNTPNHIALHEKLAALENAEAALVTASGMAAITTSVLTVLGQGDHVLAQDCLYGGTHDFFSRDLADFGIEHDFIDATDPESWPAKCQPTTRAIYVETMTNPTLQVADLRAVVAFARERGLASMIDNTFATPINFRPAELGFDLSLHSGTKYLNGHSDIVAGAVIGRRPLLERVKRRLDHLGATLDPHACFLLHRGLKSLALRIRQQNDSAQRLAERLERHPAIDRVNYPGLASHAGHARARELFDGCGGMLSFELAGGSRAAHGFVRALRLAIFAPSLGGPETLVTLPALTSHAGLAPEARARLGITDALVRVSVGIESFDDLAQDVEHALERAQ
ncbi:MAG: aminotransferase class I/II-fold pyridoxal phosphate-dependent enzyme [Acidobacteriota bacterium]|nr:MAG: aminotransferase class I/II-fold pyridoxal phosphate-dependent enzyme [Acidobacteriota bacterium]